jgi:ABC-type Na+ transport system ATPase subunit NatA
MITGMLAPSRGTVTVNGLDTVRITVFRSTK